MFLTFFVGFLYRFQNVKYKKPNNYRALSKHQDQICRLE